MEKNTEVHAEGARGYFSLGSGESWTHQYLSDHQSLYP